MRTTVTRDDDTAELVARRMREQGVTFGQALNDAIRAGVPDPGRAPVRTRTADLGTPTVTLDRAWLLAGDLEDDDAGGNLTNDAHLAALAVDHRCTVVTDDRDVARVAAVRSGSPSTLGRRGRAPGLTPSTRSPERPFSRAPWTRS